LVTEVTAVMKTMICSETLRLPTGPQLEDTRFPGQGVGTDRERCSGGAQLWCEVGIGRTPGPSDVAEERRRPCRARSGHNPYG
jgi:hypothetical protein